MWMKFNRVTLDTWQQLKTLPKIQVQVGYKPEFGGFQCSTLLEICNMRITVKPFHVYLEF